MVRQALVCTNLLPERFFILARHHMRRGRLVRLTITLCGGQGRSAKLNLLVGGWIRAGS